MIRTRIIRRIELRQYHNFFNGQRSGTEDQYSFRDHVARAAVFGRLAPQ